MITAIFWRISRNLFVKKIANANLAFGIESEEIEEAFGMSVVNMELRGSLGNAFLERMALFNVRDGDIQAPAISDSEAQRLNDLNDYLAERGATLLIAGYPIADTPDRPSDEVYVGFKKDLSEKLKAPVISDFTDYIYPTNYFFDTIFHLNNVGKKARTSRLIQDLRNYYSE